MVLTAEEIIGYVERKGLAAAAREVDVVTTATFGADVLLGLLPELRPREAAHPDDRGVDRRRGGLLRHRGRGRVPGRHAAAAGTTRPTWTTRASSATAAGT